MSNQIGTISLSKGAIMLKDITKNTKWVLDQFIEENKPIHSKRALYDLYRALQEVISNVRLVSEHYLALDFKEPHLQGSQLGEPADKWRYFFNRDLEALNGSVKNYFMKLNHIAPSCEDGINESYLSRKYNAKSFYGFVRDDYNVGLVQPCSLTMICTVLDTTSNSEENRYIEKFFKIDLTTFEQRVALQKNLREKNELLLNHLIKVKNYILTNCKLEELL
jgi:hypothetical protein